MGHQQVSAELLIYSKHSRNKHLGFHYLNSLRDKLSIEVDGGTDYVLLMHNIELEYQTDTVLEGAEFQMHWSSDYRFPQLLQVTLL